MPQVPSARNVAGQKWGLTATAPGSWALLSLSTLLTKPGSATSPGNATAAAAPAAAAAPGRLYLAHTRSWEERGTATVACVGGCACNATKVLGAGCWVLSKH